MKKIEKVKNSAGFVRETHERYSLLNSFDYEEFCSNLDLIAFPFFPAGYRGSDYTWDEKNPPARMGLRILYKAPQKKLNKIKKLFIEEHNKLKDKFYNNEYLRGKYARINKENIDRMFYSLAPFNYIDDMKHTVWLKNLYDKNEEILMELRVANHKKSWFKFQMSLQHLLHNHLFEDLLEYEYDYRYGNLAFKCLNTNTMFYSALPFADKQYRSTITANLLLDLESFYDNIPVKFYDKNSGFEYDNVFHKLKDFESIHNQLEKNGIIGLHGGENKKEFKIQQRWYKRHTQIIRTNNKFISI